MPYQNAQGYTANSNPLSGKVTLCGGMTQHSWRRLQIGQYLTSYQGILSGDSISPYTHKTAFLSLLVRLAEAMRFAAFCSSSKPGGRVLVLQLEGEKNQIRTRGIVTMIFNTGISVNAVRTFRLCFTELLGNSTLFTEAEGEKGGLE